MISHEEINTVDEAIGAVFYSSITHEEINTVDKAIGCVFYLMSHEEVQTDGRHNEPVAHPAGVTETRVRQAHRRRRRARQGQGRVSTVFKG